MITETDFKRELKRICGLKQNKGKTEEELRPLARINLLVRELKSNPIFTDADEQKLAEEKYRSYLTHNEIESDSDIDVLKSLIFNEILELRIQKELNALSQDNKYPPKKLVETLTDIQDQKDKLKIKLGINKEDGQKDELTNSQRLEQRVIEYINNHKLDYSFNLGFQCEECGYKNWDSFLLFKKVKDFDSAIKNPWFLGRWLFNYELFKDVKDGKISAEDATRYLMCCGNGDFYQPSNDDKKWCTDYINYCIENWIEITDLMNKK